MTYAAGIIADTVLCSNCQSPVEVQAKFCGHCGFVTATTNLRMEEATAPVEAPRGLPSFATAGIPAETAKTNELIVEANKLMLHLARERLFLILHWGLFIFINLFGVWAAWKCYVDFCGDEMSKMMVASTPFLFINSMGLLCLVPIKGTRSQIAFLKERISYLRFNIEFGHLSFYDQLRH